MVMPMIPQIQLQPVPAYGPAPLTVGFFLSSLNPESAPLASYIWNFGDGQVSMLPPTALFLASEEGRYYTGSILHPDGGIVMQ